MAASRPSLQQGQVLLRVTHCCQNQGVPLSFFSHSSREFPPLELVPVAVSRAGHRIRPPAVISVSLMSLWCRLCKGGLQRCTTVAQRWAGTYSRPTLQDYYHVLGVERNATSGEIKNAFFALSKKCHPDSDPTNPLLHAQFVRLNEAYNVLSKSSSRRQYDQVLETIQRGRASADRSWKRTSPQGAGTTEGYRKEQHYTWYTPGEDSYYWSHFPPQSNYDEPSEKRQQRNRNIVWACVIGSFVSIYLHFCVFSTIRDIRNKEIEEQQRRIMDFYNMTRENARMNSFSKQQEILLQRHEDRLKKLYGREDDPKK